MISSGVPVYRYDVLVVVWLLNFICSKKSQMKSIELVCVCVYNAV